MTLTIRLVPGLWGLCPLPSRDKVFATIKTFGGPRAHFGHEEAVISMEHLEEAADFCRDLFEAFRLANQILTGANVAPFQAVWWPEQDTPPKLFEIAPPGYLLFPDRFTLPDAAPWPYGCTICSLSWDEGVKTLRFPYRSLLLLGEHHRECFFCGSHRHEPQECSACWGDHAEGFTVDTLADISPEIWPEALIHAEDGIPGLRQRLEDIQVDLRREFQIHYALKVANSTAAHFSEIDQFPVKMPSGGDLKQIFEAIDAQDRTGLERGLRKIRSEEDVFFQILSGFSAVLHGRWDDAMAGWWHVENMNTTPLHKAYACLLQLRLHLLRGNMEGARAAAERGLKADADAAPLLYWQTVVNALVRNGRGVSQGLHPLSARARWFVAAMTEPYLLAYENQVEQYFNTLYAKAEEEIHLELKKLDLLLDQAERSFGPETFEDCRKDLRDWRGSLPRKGMAQLQSARGFLGSIQQKIFDHAAKLRNQLVGELKDSYDDVATIAEHAGAGAAHLGTLRAECADLLGRITQTMSKFKHSQNLGELAGLHEEVASLRQEATELRTRGMTAMEKAWQMAQLRRYIAIGAGVVGAAWLVFYLISLVIEILRLY